MTQTLCKTCKGPKAVYACGLCEEVLCKKCAEFLSETFSFQRKVPASLTHSCYCSQCFDAQVAGPLAEYEQNMERAKEVYIFTKEQTKITRLLSRKNPPYLVEECEDQQEAILRLSFLAVADGFNTLIDVQVKTRKIVVGSHKKTIFSASGVPVTINPDEIGNY